MIRTDHDRGFATVLGAFVIAAIAATIVGVLYVGGAVVSRHRAQSAADLAALAAAQELMLTEKEPCAVARQLIDEQEVKGRLSRCVIDGDDVELTVDVPVSLGPFGVHLATASARAGPVDSGPDGAAMSET